jgi:hypothetical protein
VSSKTSGLGPDSFLFGVKTLERKLRIESRRGLSKARREKAASHRLHAAATEACAECQAAVADRLAALLEAERRRRVAQALEKNRTP